LFTQRNLRQLTLNSSFFKEILYKNAGSGCLLGEVASAKTSETSWCEQVYETKSAGLLLYGRALGLSHGEAEDILQETFFALLQMPSAPAQPEHYCVRSFRNRALNSKRSLWRRLTRELESHRWFERSEAESPYERAAMRCLVTLPPEQREVIVLKIWHRYTFEEIGQLLEISPNTAAGRYRYGLEKLRVCLKGEDYERLESVGETIGILAPTRPLGQA
jgi:RNA polymerase sigma-70 factor, ECF subfamily